MTVWKMWQRKFTPEIYSGGIKRNGGDLYWIYLKLLRHTIPGGQNGRLQPLQFFWDWLLFLEFVF